MPRAGIRTMGAREVAGIGIASVAHQAASSIIRPAAFQAASFMPSGAGTTRVMISSRAPTIRPIARLAVQPLDWDSFVVVADILLSNFEFHVLALLMQRAGHCADYHQ